MNTKTRTKTKYKTSRAENTYSSFVVVLTQTPEAREPSYFGFTINVKCEDLSKGNMSQNNDTLGWRKKNNRYAGVPSTLARNVSHMNATYKKVPLPTHIVKQNSNLIHTHTTSIFTQILVLAGICPNIAHSCVLDKCYIACTIHHALECAIVTRVRPSA